MDILHKRIAGLNIQRILVTLCIFGVCAGTQQIQTVAWNTGIIEFARDSLGVLMAVILFTNYSRHDFAKYKLPYIIWSAASVLAGAFLIPYAFRRRADFLKADTVVIALGVFLMGFCVIHTVISFFIEKKRPRLYRPLFIIWTLMLILMIFSRSDYIWPKCYFVLFLCYYLTPQTPAQRRNVSMGLVNGLILSFILIQAHSLLFRPYDKVRYQGNFCNPNNNSLFLCLCLAGILAKILFVTRDNEKKLIRIFYFLLAGACYSLICMTIGRSGYLATFVITIFFLAAYCRIRERKIFIRTGALLVALFVAILPVTYLAVRYIPTIHPHVLFYYQEGYSESFVHSWDSRDSEKYISFRQMLGAILGRFEILTGSTGTPSSTVSLSTDPPAEADTDFFGGEVTSDGSSDVAGNAEDDSSDTAGNTEADSSHTAGNAEADSSDTAGNTEGGSSDTGNDDNGSSPADRDEAQTPPDRAPILSEEEMNDPLLVRYTIYHWFFTHLTLRGMPYAEQGLQLTEGYWVQHAHNIYLEYGINFGYPVMILFTVFVWWGIFRLARQGLKKKDSEKLSCLLIALIPPVFGMFEFAWGAGLISTVAFYMAFKEMFTERDAS